MIDIFGTLGPACADADTLERMLRRGMTGVRLNLSHVTLVRSAAWVAALHEAEGRCGVQAKLLIDMQGPELRIGALDAPMELTEGETVSFGPEGIRVAETIRAALQPEQEILLDDGRILLSMRGDGKAVVKRGGVLQSRKSIALPGVELAMPALTDADLENIAAARDYGVTGLMQPFVRDRADLLAVRQALRDAGAQEVLLYAKIENQQGMQALPTLLDAADEFVIARGDLGNAMPLWELPAAQKRIAAQCRGAYKPFMVVTQMLASMEHSPVPTRAEVSDVFNAVLDGATSVMVTGETAVGDYPVETITYLTETVQAAERYLGIGG